MGDLEKVGLLKMDFLGLRTLTLLDKARQARSSRRAAIDIDPHEAAARRRGDVTRCCSAATPRASSSSNRDGIRDLLQADEAGQHPRHHRHASPSTAPARSTAAWSTSTSTASTAARQPTYPHPVMEEILAETYGVMVYQEQVMRILNRLGGIELSSAYACIKAISKKKHDDHRRSARPSSSRGPQERGVDAEQGRRDLRPDREVRRLRLQQVAHRRPTPRSPTRPRT